MDKEKYKEWLDKVVENIKERELLSICEEGKLCLCNDPERIQIYSGIDILAGAVGIALEEKDFKKYSPVFPYEYHFVYKGIYFLQLSQERMIVNGRSD